MFPKHLSKIVWILATMTLITSSSGEETEL